MSYARSAVDEYVSSTQFQMSLPETLQFEARNLQDITKFSQETIAGLEVAIAMLREQLVVLTSGYLESLSQQALTVKILTRK